jgi:hypothetical protein
VSDAFHALARAQAVLEDGLAFVDRGQVDDAGAPEVIAKLAAELAALPDPVDLRATVAAADLERFDDELEELIRLNAVLMAALRADRDDVALRLVAIREARRGKRDAAPTGVRCDVSG